MTKTSLIAACLTPFTGAGSSGAAAPEVQIANASLRARVYLPDAKNGFYRGTRFDWAGMVGSVQFDRHEFFPQWFQRVDLAVHDFVYAGPEIVASPCTAATGPAEEFVSQGKALGFDEAKPDETFIKIGVGVLRRPDAGKYDPYRLYEIVDAGKWTVRPSSESVEFQQEVTDPSTGYAYTYSKVLRLAKDKAQLSLEHTLRNTGERIIQTSVYNHNFLYLNRRPPTPECSISFPFTVQTAQPPDSRVVRVQGNRIIFNKTFEGEDKVYLSISGFGADAKDYDIRIENRKAGAGVRITSDRPLARLALWSIRAPLSVEPFIDMTIEPGAEFSWRINYDFYSVPTGTIKLEEP